MIEFTQTFPQYVNFGSSFKNLPQRTVIWSVYFKVVPPTSCIHGLAWITSGTVQSLDYSFSSSIAVGSAPIGHLAYTSRFSTHVGTWRTTSAYMSSGTWYRFAITHDVRSSANDPVLYVNGQSVSITETDTPAGSYVSGTSIQEFGFGGWGGSTPNGYEDAPLLYNRVLTASEIANEYASHRRISNRNGLVFAPNMLGAKATDGDTINQAGIFKCPISGVTGLVPAGSPKFRASPILTYGGL